MKHSGCRNLCHLWVLETKFTQAVAFAALLLLVATPGVTAAPGDIVFKRQGDDASLVSFPPAQFPHWVHRVNYRCDACHDSLFRMQAGSSEVNMALIRDNKACGSCHNGDQAFDITLANCSRCHRNPQ